MELVSSHRRAWLRNLFQVSCETDGDAELITLALVNLLQGSASSWHSKEALNIFMNDPPPFPERTGTLPDPCVIFVFKTTQKIDPWFTILLPICILVPTEHTHTHVKHKPMAVSTAVRDRSFMSHKMFNETTLHTLNTVASGVNFLHCSIFLLTKSFLSVQVLFGCLYLLLAYSCLFF